MRGLMLGVVAALVADVSLAAPPAGDPQKGAAQTSVAPAVSPDEAFADRRYGEARTGYAKAAKHKPADLALRHRLAVSSLLAEKPAAAQREALSVVASDEGGAPASADVARIAQAMRQDKGQAGVDLAAIEATLEEGRWRTAAHMAGQALSDPKLSAATRGRLMWARGRALAALGQGPQAWEALTAAGALGAADASLWWWLSNLAGRTGQRTLARSFSELSVDLMPEGSPLAPASGAR
ncbi:MAG: hypothetical protein ACE366_01180 [Bradymonadia bacterium]